MNLRPALQSFLNLPDLRRRIHQWQGNPDPARLKQLFGQQCHVREGLQFHSSFLHRMRYDQDTFQRLRRPASCVVHKHQHKLLGPFLVQYLWTDMQVFRRRDQVINGTSRSGRDKVALEGDSENSNAMKEIALMRYRSLFCFFWINYKRRR